MTTTTTPQDIARKYRQIRHKEPLTRAKDALSIAHLYYKEHPPFGKPFEKDGFEVILSMPYDDSPDLSFYGKFTDKWEPGVIKNLGGWYGPDYTEQGRDEYPWFVPGYDHFGDIEKYTAPSLGSHAAWVEARRRTFQDMKYAAGEDGSVYVLVAKVYREGILLGRATIGGITTSDDWQIYGDDEQQVWFAAEDVLDEAINDARENLAKLIATAR